MFFGNTIRENIPTVFPTPFDVIPKSMKESIGSRLARTGRSMFERNKMATEGKFPERDEGMTASNLTRDVAAGGVSILSSIGQGLLFGPGVAAVGFGAQAAGEGFFEAGQTDKPIKESLDIGAALGLAEGGLEFAGLDRFLKIEGGAIKRAINGYLTEFLQEFSQQGASGTIKTITGLREWKGVETLKEILSESLYAGAIGGVLGAGASVTLGLSISRETEKTLKGLGVEPQKAKQAVDDIMQAASEAVVSTVEGIDQQMEQSTVQATQTETVEPTQVQVPEQEALFTEARKYKTAEEFVASQTVFRGQKKEFLEVQKIAQTDAIDNILIGRGIFTTTDIDVAKTYGENIFRFSKPYSGVLDLAKLTENDFKNMGLDKKNDWGVRPYDIYKTSLDNNDLKSAEDIFIESIADKHLPESVTFDDVKNGMTVDEGILIDEIRDKMLNDLRENGFSWLKSQGGIRSSKGTKLHDVYIALSDDALKPVSEQQLTTIWQQAQEQGEAVTAPKETTQPTESQWDEDDALPQNLKPKASGRSTLEEKLAAIEERVVKRETSKEALKYLMSIKKQFIRRIKPFKKGVELEEMISLPKEYLNKNGTKLDEVLDYANESLGLGLESTSEFIDYLKNLANNIVSLKAEIAEPLTKQVTMTDLAFIKQRIADVQTGMRKGTVKTKADVKLVQEEFIKNLSDKKLDTADEGAFLTTLKNIQTKEQLERAMPAINARIKRLVERKEKKSIKSKIYNELKYTKPVKKGAFKVGKYDFESNMFFKDLKSLDKLTQDQAQLQLNAFIGKENLSEMDLIKRRFLSYKNGGMEASLDLHKQVLADIQNLKMLGEAAKDDADFEIKVNKKENFDEMMSALEKNKGDITSFKNKVGSAYIQGIGNLYSKLNAIFDKNIAEKFDLTVNEMMRTQQVFKENKVVINAFKNIYGIKGNLAVMTKKMELQSRHPSNTITMTSVNGENHLYSKAQLIDIYNSIKNDLIRERYLNHFGAEQINLALENLSPADMLLADTLMKELPKYFPILRQHMIKRTGLDLGYHEVYWMATSETSIDIFDDLKSQSQVPTSEQERSASSRIKPRPVDAFDKFNKYIYQAEHVANISEKWEQLKNLLLEGEVRRGIEKRYGAKTYQSLMEQVDASSLNRKVQVLDAMSSFFMEHLNNWMVSKTALNVGPTSRQLSSATNFSENMPVGEWSKGFAKALSNPKKTFDYMWKNVPYLEARFNKGYDELSAEALESANKMKPVLGEVKNWMTLNTRAGDITAIIYGGYPYLKHLEKTMSKEEAVKVFMKDVGSSQQLSEPSSLADTQRQLGLLTPFNRFKNTAFQYTRKMGDAIISHNKGDITDKQFAKIMFHYGVLQPTFYAAHLWRVSAFIGASALALLQGEEPDEDEFERIKNDIMIQLIINPFMAIPVLYDVAVFTARKNLDMKVGRDIFSTAFFDDADKMFQFVVKLWEEKDTIDVSFIEFFEGTGLAVESRTALPVQTFIRAYRDLTGQEKKSKSKTKKKIAIY